MDLITYNQIYQYLQILEHSSDIIYSQRWQLTMIASNYFIENNQLYHHTANPTHQHQVILQSKLPRILWLNHQHPLGGHFGIIATYKKLNNFIIRIICSKISNFMYNNIIDVNILKKEKLINKYIL